jgi:chromosome segregation ATPase
VYILGIATAVVIMLICTFALQGFTFTTASSSLYQQSSEDAYGAEINSAILKIGSLSASISQTNKDLTKLRIGVSEAVKQMQEASLQSNEIRSQIYSISDVPEKYKDSHTQLLLSMDAMQKSVESSLASLEHLEAAEISHGQLTLWLLNAPEST